MKQEYIISFESGKVSPSLLTKIEKDFAGMKDGRLRIGVERFRSKRSDSQNRFLHQMFTILKNGLNELGNEFTKDEVKELCKFKFAKIDIINHETGEVIGQRIKGTSEMNKTEMSEFIENVIRWSSDMFHIVIEPPNSQLTINQ